MQQSLKINTTPVELTTTEGYEEFVKSPLAADYSTVFPDGADNGYVMDNNSEVVATVALNVRHSLENPVPSYGSPEIKKTSLLKI
ncbi:CYFA0S05e04566g1_1 [Cyberlindnera fabianii]|uniref:ATP-dependent (S)-NAD(P)H-hydrate dehydratase n=1 Tax=Cyberlindnera fabianii TaxID=36022 RepID=A0A061AT23_CYBFA|nr:ATP-dependent (S)-NAD(P)H-hydrate dehydratase [Cyberlindnera fabianii]CDR40794.1 CYFA0S05e04566g1_1 [Cyberlindnera fabianii]